MERKVYVCDLCDRRFASKQRLDYHKDHSVCQKPDPNICPYCDMRFCRKERLQYHLDHMVCLNKPKLIMRKQTPTIPTSQVSEEIGYQNFSKEELIHLMQLKDTEIRVLKENPKTVNNNINTGFCQF